MKTAIERIPAAIAMALFTFAAQAAENAGWGGGTGFWSDTNWYPASAPATASAWTAGNYAVFTNGTQHALDLADGTFTAASLRTPAGTTAARTEVVVSNGTLVLDNAINGTGALDGNFMKSAVFTFGEGCTVRNDTAKWGLGLNNDSHIVFGPGSTYNETYSAKYNEVEAQGSNFIGANNANSNSVTICEGANVNLKRRLVIGGVLGPKQTGNANTIGVLHIKGGNLKLTDDAYLFIARNVSGWGPHNSNGKGYLIQDGGTVETTYFSMGTVWGKSYGSNNGKAYLTLNAGTFKAQYTHLGYQNEVVITINGGTFDAGYFRLGATENTTQGSNTGNNQCYVKNNKLYLNGGVFKLRYMNFNDEKGSTTGGVWCNGGTLKPTASFNTSSGSGTANFIINAGGLTVDTDSGITFGLYQQVKGGAGAITKTGAGTMVLTWAPLNTGGFIVNGGVLNVGGTSTGTVKITGPLVVNNGGTIYMNENAANRSPCSGLITLNEGAKVKVPVSAQGDILKTPAGQSGVVVNGAVSFVFNVKPAPGVHTVLESVSGSGILFDDEDLALFSAPAVPEAVFSLSSDKTKVLMTVPPPAGSHVWIGGTDGLFSTAANWIGGSVPSGSGAKVYFSAGGAITNDLQNFAPASLTFSGSIGERAVLDGNAITGISAITNRSNCSVELKMSVNFGTKNIDVVQTATISGIDSAIASWTPPEGRVIFSGGVYGKSFVRYNNHNIISGHYHLSDTARFTAEAGGSDRIVVAPGSSLNIVESDKIGELYIMGEFYVKNSSHGWGDKNARNRLWCWNNGGRFRTDAYNFYGAGQMFLGGYRGNATSVALNKNHAVQAGSVKTTGTGALWLHAYDNSSGVDYSTIYVGSGGMANTSTGYMGVENSAHQTVIRPLNSNFTIARGKNGSYDIRLGNGSSSGNIQFFLRTDDKNGVPRQITLAGLLKTEVYTSSVTVSGGGTNRVSSASTGMTGTYTVANGATAVFDGGKGFQNGTVSVAAGGRLVAGGASAAAGKLKIANGSTLEFKLDGASCTSFAAASLTQAASGAKATIAFTPGSSKIIGQSYTLVTGANLSSTAAFALPEDDNGTLSVVNGNLVYTAPTYFYIKIAESTASKLVVPLEWIGDNTAASVASGVSEIADALERDGENGIPVWQSYCMGLDPNDAGNAVLCAPAAEQPSEAGKVAIEIPRSSVPAELSGVTVKAYLDVKRPGRDWDNDETGETVSSGAILRTAEVSDSGISFFA